MKKGLTLTVVLLIAAAALAVVGFVQKGDVQKKLDETTAKLAEATSQVDTVKADADARISDLTAQAEAFKTDAEAKTAELTLQMETLTAEANAKTAELTAQMETLTAGADTKTAELTAQIDTLTADAEAKAAELNTQIEALKAEADSRTAELTAQIQTLTADAEAKAKELTAQVEILTADLEAAKAAPAPEAPKDRYGLGIVTSIGSVADDTAEKAGAAQVNTTVCSLVLDAQGLIKSVTWDVQQTRIQFSIEGKPVDLPADLLTKLEKGEDYGMRKASVIDKEWFEQIDAFAAYCVGRTVEEVLATPTVDDAPAVEELKASVTISIGDYLASLQKAAANAK